MHPSTLPEGQGVIAGPARSRLPFVLAGFGIAFAVAAGVLLWASEGATVFLAAAANAFLTCF